MNLVPSKANEQPGYYQAPARFLQLSKVLVDQLNQTDTVHVETDLVPTLIELAATADSATQHKELNSSILQCARSPKVQVRRAAVRCQRGITDRLGEAWLTLLPELLPVIGELQEDDDENVEEETLAWIQAIEKVMGESLDPMLQ